MQNLKQAFSLSATATLWQIKKDRVASKPVFNRTVTLRDAW